jgi:uncharacterized membrane protein
MKDNNSRFLVYTLLFQAIVCFSIILDISFIRQVLGFIFLAFIPGFLFLKAFGIERRHFTEIFVLSVGLSIAFLMMLGLAMNELGSLGLLKAPLATEPILVSANVIVACLSIFVYLTKKDVKVFGSQNLRKLWRSLPLFLLPLLTIISVLCVSYFQTNILSIFVIIVTAIVLVVSILRHDLSSYYPLIIFSITIALLLGLALMSNYLYGDDILGEFKTFIETKNALSWNPESYSTVQQSSDVAMLSVSILPTIFSNLLNIEPGWVFKIVFLVIFSIIPLGLFELYRKHWSEKIAFISVIFFIANYNFFTGILSEAKQMIGELFFVILFLELLTSKEDSYKSSWGVLFFALFGLVVSHYSLDFIFIIIIFSGWIGAKIFWRKAYSRINSSIVAFTSCFVFFWYVFVVPSFSAGPFEKFIGVISRTSNSFVTEFFQSSSRGQVVQAALGQGTFGTAIRPSVFHNMGTILYDITILAILIGFISLVIISKKDKSKREYALIASANVILLILAIVLPRFADFLEMGRLYQVLLMLLSPLFVLGLDAVSKNLPKLKKLEKLKIKRFNANAIYSTVLILIILVPFFLFQTGFIYEITDDPSPSSFSLSYYKMQNSSLLIHECDVFSAQWLSTYGNITKFATYADPIAQSHVLNSYSTINQGLIILLSNSTQLLRGDSVVPVLPKNPDNSYIYLSQFNIHNNMIWWYQRMGISFKLDELTILNGTNAVISRIYSNGDSEVYFRTS